MYYFIVLTSIIRENQFMQDFFTKNYKTISKNFKKLRTSEGLSQEKFGEIIDCTREYVSRLENNREKASLKLILLASYKFDKDINYFFKD